MSWTRVERLPTLVLMAPAARAFVRSSIGLKVVMAVTGAVLGLFVVAHMVGNLKFFEGATAFDGYAAWLRTIGSPVLGPSWYLWLQRAGLLGCVIAHIAAAAALT